MDKDLLSAWVYIICFSLGYLIGGLAGVIIAFFVARFILQVLSKENNKINSNNNANEVFYSHKESLIIAISSILAKMVKADGKIDENESNTIYRIFKELGFVGKDRELAKKSYLKATRDNKSVYEYLRDFNKLTSDKELRKYLYASLWMIALSDGKLTESEERILKEAPSYLGLSSFIFNDYYYEYVDSGSNNNKQSNNNNSSSSYSSSSSIDKYFTILNCSPNDDMKTVKKAYRKLVAEYHPDKIIAKGLPDSFVEFANKELQKINEAYEAIKKYKGW